MRNKLLVAVAVIVGIGLGSAVWAESPSVLLEKAIYTEETVGDLDAAIEIYKQIIADAKANRRHAAQAHLRLGMCYQKDGRETDAVATFEKLIKDFPEQKDLVAKAREHIPGDLVLEPVPWVDGEVLELTIKLQTDMDIGTFIFSADSAEVDGRDVWRLQTRRFITIQLNQGVSRVDADFDTFRPINSLFKHSLLGHVECVYGADQVEVRTKSRGRDTTRKADIDSVYYDNEQAMHLMRRLPLAVGYKTPLPIHAAFGSGCMKIRLEVTGKETIRVPAGEFECYKLELSIVNQTMWISTDPNRYMVKFAAGGVTGELASIGQSRPGELNEYKDDDLGVSLSAPAGWFFYKAVPPSGDKGEATVHILDPEAAALCFLEVDTLESLGPEKSASPRAWVEIEVPEKKKHMKDLEVRPDSWKERTISGQPAVSLVAEHVDGERKMADYATFVLGKSKGVRLIMRIEREQLDGVRDQFDAIVDSLKIR